MAEHHGQSETSTRPPECVITDRKSRVFRQIVRMEIVWTVEEGESDFRDWEGLIRGAVMEAPAWPGIGEISEIEELT